MGHLGLGAEPLKSNWVPPGRQERYGHAEGLVAATPEAIKSRLVDYAHFGNLAGPKFRRVNVIQKRGDRADLYFQLPIMKGALVLWYVTSFEGPRSVDDSWDVIEGTFVRGNIENMHIVFGVGHGDSDRTSLVTCDLLLKLQIPAPQATVDEELRDACGDALNALRRATAPL